MLLGFSVLLAGCGESEAPVQQQAYQQIPRLSAEDENLIFGDATHVDIYEQLSVGPSDLLESSGDPLPENPSPDDAESFFADQKPVTGQQTPLFGDPASVSDAPVLGESDSIFDDKNPVDETPLSEIKPLDDPSGDSVEPESLKNKP